MRLIASDYDGTLRRNDTVTETDRSAIKSWQSAGHLFGLISGRSYSSLVEELTKNNVTYDFLICNNGGVIYDEISSIFERTTTNGIILSSLVDFIINRGGYHAAISNDEKRICVDIGKGKTPTFSDFWIDPIDINKIIEFTQLDTRFDSIENAKEFAADVNETYGESITAHQNDICVDIVPVGVSKPSGLLKYLKMKDISKENAIVIGDNQNDLDMILEFSGYCVESAIPEVIAKSKRTYSNIAELVYDHI